MNRPSVDECELGLERILDKINPQQMIMLRAHYYSAGRAATVRELATAAGYSDFKMANLQYGNLAKRLYQAIGYPKPTSPRSGKGYWILGLGEFVRRRDFGLEMQCVMRPEIAQALERMGIVDSSETSDEMPDEAMNVTVSVDETEVTSLGAGPTTTDELSVSEAQEISVDLIRSGRFPLLDRLGMIFAPGWSLDESEAEWLRMEALTREGKINLIRIHASVEGSVPESMSEVVTMAANFRRRLRNGETVIVHCKDNPEFIGLTVACIAIAATDAEISSSEAIALVHEARPGAIETEEQEQFVADFVKEWRDVMAKRGRNYLLYWQERSVMDHATNDLPLDVVASNQLMGVFPGDTIWIVTLTEERQLVLAGKMVVGEIVEYEEAIRRMPDAGLWQAEYYAFPEPGTEEYLRPMDIHDIAEELRFEGENDRLIVRDGKINPRQLRSMRKLTPETADLFEQAFDEEELIHADDMDPEELLDRLLDWVEDKPDDPHAHYNLGVALGRNGMDENAVAAFQRTLELDPEYFAAQYNLGNTFLRLGRYDQAIEALNKAILIDGDYPPAHFMLGVAYFEAGRAEDAIAATRLGLEIDPDDEGAYYNIAYWTFQLGDYRRSISYCDDVIAKFPFFTSPYVLKGMCFRELGEYDNEIDAYRLAVDIKVDDEGAFVINFTALFFLGAAWERKITGSDEGIEYVVADNYFNLQDPLHQFCFAMGHLAQGDSEYAEGAIEDLRTSAPDLARRLEHALAL